LRVLNVNWLLFDNLKIKVKMVDIRIATVQDMQNMQQCNLLNLPENYSYMYYLYHSLSWPHILFVAESEEGKIVGYVMAKLEDDDNDKKKNIH